MTASDRPSQDPPDSESHRLHAQARSGEQRAVQSLLVQHLEPLRAFVRLQLSPVLRARETESDIVQRVCVEVLKRAGGFEYRGEAEFRAWLYRSVLNAIRDGERFHKAHRRDVRREEAAPASESLAGVYRPMSSPSGRAMAAEDVGHLEAAFSRLPERYAEVLALLHVAGLSRQQVAAQLGVSVDAVSKLARRAALRLAKELGSGRPTRSA